MLILYSLQMGRRLLYSPPDFMVEETYLKRRRSTLAWTASVAGMIVVLTTGCTGTSGQAEQAKPPKPKTVVVEKTVEVQAEPSTTEETTSGVTNPGAAEMSCEVGQECDLGESNVAITSANQTQSINTSLGETYEGNFVVVEYDYTYGGNTPVETDEPPFQLLDKDGNTYSLSFDPTSDYEIDNDRSLIYETVQPGVTAQGAAIFEVSPDAEDFTLLIMDLISPQANKSAKVPLQASGQPSSSSSEGVSEEEPAPAVASSVDSLVSSYYEAVSREDWSATYSMLDSESQAAFTEDEWVQKQIARNAAASPPPLTTAVVNSVSEQGSDQFVNVTLNYDDGSQETLDIAIRSEGGEYKRHLTADEIAFLNSL